MRLCSWLGVVCTHSLTRLSPPCDCPVVADIKRRDTTNYLLCTGGNGQLLLWSLNPITGELASVKVATSSYQREYTSLLFSPNREWLYAGTTSGDFACISVRGAVSRSFCIVVYRRLTHRLAVVVGVAAHARAQIKSRSLHTFVSCCSGGVLSLTAPDDTRMVVSGGDGTVASYVGEGKEWVDEATVKVQGAVHNVSSSPDGAEVLAGTADGHIYRIKLGARGTRPTVLPVCESHASAAASLEEGLGRARTCARPLTCVLSVMPLLAHVLCVFVGLLLWLWVCRTWLAVCVCVWVWAWVCGCLWLCGMARAPGTTASGTKETSASRATNAVGGVAAVAYPPKFSDKFATVGADNTVRVWDASDYSVPIMCSVKNGGHPSSIAYSLDALLSGWEDGKMRCHSADTGELLWSVTDAHRGGVTALCMSNNQRFAVRGMAVGGVGVGVGGGMF